MTVITLPQSGTGLLDDTPPPVHNSLRSWNLNNRFQSKTFHDDFYETSTPSVAMTSSRTPVSIVSASFSLLRDLQQYNMVIRQTRIVCRTKRAEPAIEFIIFM